MELEQMLTISLGWLGKYITKINPKKINDGKLFEFKVLIKKTEYGYNFYNPTLIEVKKEIENKNIKIFLNELK